MAEGYNPPGDDEHNMPHDPFSDGDAELIAFSEQSGAELVLGSSPDATEEIINSLTAGAEYPEKIWTDEELKPIAQELYSNLSYWIMPPRMRAALAQTEIVVATDDYSDRAYGKPPQIVTPKPRLTKIEFDKSTYQDLAERFAQLEGATESDIVELYIGAGLVLHLLAKRIKTMPQTAMLGLLNLLGPPGGSKVGGGGVDDFADAIRRADDHFTREEIIDLVHGTVFMDEEHRTYTNTLRFAAGLLFDKQSDISPPILEESVPSQHALRPESNLTSSYRKELKHRLAEQRARINFYKKALGMTDDKAERRAAENLSELQLAVAFPMNRSEMQPILEICQTQYK